MKDPEQLTYAISLLPDQEAAAPTVRFTKSGVRLDLGAIAKGYAADCLVEILREVPPHLTLGVFHAREADLPRLRELFKEFSERARGGGLLVIGSMQAPQGNRKGGLGASPAI